MSAPTFAWKSAAKIAWRDMHASRGKFLFVTLAVAIGVGALTGIRGSSEAFKRTLLTRARTIMAADLAARFFDQPNAVQEQQLAELATEGVVETRVTELVSMASATDHDPLLISLKAVDTSAYPFYGKVDLEPAGTLRDVLRDDTAVVADDLLVRMGVGVGDTLRIGQASFRIAAVLVNEPDRLSASMALGPRVLITQRALAGTGLLQPGSRAGEHILFRLPPAGVIDDFKRKVETILPEAQVTDFRETNPALTQGLERSTSLLSLVSLVALVLGAIGVAMAMRAHIEQRVDTIAIMKSLGARSRQVMRIYILQTLLLGTLGGLLGVVLGAAVERIFPYLLRKLIPMQVTYDFPLHAIGVGLAVGILTTLLFTLPPLLDIRKVRPSLILRRAVTEPEDASARGLLRRIAGARLQIGAAVLILAGLGVIAATLSDSQVVGRWFTLALVAVLVVLLSLARFVLWLLRKLLSATRSNLPSTIRHGLANLYRPGNQSATVLAALGTGIMLVTTVFLMQKAIVRELGDSSSPNLPNVFLIDISSREVAGVKELMQKQAGVGGQLETVPVVIARLAAINGTPLNQLTLTDYPKRFLQSVSLSYADTQPTGLKTVAGKWWPKGNQAAEISIGSRTAGRIHVGVGSTLTFTAGGKQIETRVVATHTTDGQHVFSRSEFIVTPAALSGLTPVWYGAVHIEPRQVGAAQRALYAKYPTVTVINLADAFQTLRGVVDQIAMLIRFLASFSIVAGCIILASSIASTRFRRVREVVVMKTLGATRRRIAAVFSVEFLLMGAVAGTVGVIFANLLARVLLHKLEAGFRVEWLASVAAIAGTAAIATLSGWMASYRMLGQKPLEILREE